ncbi:Bypass of stop codon protein 6 [Colletotrichum trifolii]|uniref:Bypass of stop codon protein 6 n=1 Tax=Colletotrichum trifolii TaxID=5466 RepID=A0A4R8QR38_COLTR|nr:Bypass of stop codon protein 6 [Colletotrichum trifolii]
MDASMFKTLVKVESGRTDHDHLPTTPAKALPRTHHGASHNEASIELQRINTNPGNGSGRGIKDTGAQSPPASPSRPKNHENDLEMSRTSTPVVTDALQSISDPHMNRFRLAAACLLGFNNGLNDGAPGALIPYMEKHYKIGYAIVSLIFIGNALGFITGAVFLETLRAKLGRARLLLLSQTIVCLAYVPVVAQAPFPLIVVSFFMVGFSMSHNLAVSNVFCGSLRQATTALGFLHGSYGIGGTIGPLMATALVTAAGTRWSVYYFITLGTGIFNAVFATWSFWHYERDLPSSQQQQQFAADGDSRTQLLTMFSALKIRLVLLGAAFIFAYQGAEVSISGWVISFLITDRNGNPDAVGYVTAGFWAGITLGRFFLSHAAHRVGEKRFVFGATVGAAVFQVLVWWVPNVVGPAVSVAIVGLLLGPVYPSAISVFIKRMTRDERVSGMGVITAFGSSGGAVAPFTTGLLAQATGPWVLHPIAIGLFAAMLVCWFCIPHSPKRTE